MLDNKEKLPEREVKFTVENHVKLDPRDPIPIQYGSDLFYTPLSNRRYLPFLGRRDDYANVLLDLRLNSPTQDACVTSIAEATIGAGLIVTDQEDPKSSFFEWTKEVNNEHQSLDEVLRYTTEGERTHGNQFVEIVRGEINKKKFVKVYLHSMLYCRLSEADADDVPQSVLISKLFARRGMNNRFVLNKAREVPLWSDNLLDKNKVWVKNPDGTESTMLHVKNEIAGIDYYGLPASKSSIRQQALEAKLAQYNIDNLDNNMILGGILFFKSAMTQEEAQAQAKNILLSHVGEGKTGRIAVVSSESGLDEVDFKPYTTKQEGSFLELSNRTSDIIIAANGWSKEFCFSHTGSMGKGGAYLRSLWDLKEAMLLKPLRKKIIDKAVSPIVKIYADWMNDKEVLTYAFDFKTSMPFSFMADLDPTTFMKVNEARQLAGLESDDSKKDVYISELTKPKNVQSQSTAKEGDNNQ